MTESHFHATMNDHGAEFEFDRGGKYEKVDEYGTPVQRVAAGEFVGFEISDTPELAASKSPEAAIFAILKNYVNDTGDASGLGLTVRVNVYRLDGEPDADLTCAVAGDFAAIEEVRYREPGENPVRGELEYTVELPGRVLGDVELAYLPPQAVGVIEVWADAVQAAIRHVMNGEEYPEDVAEWAGVERPDVEAYRGR